METKERVCLLTWEEQLRLFDEHVARKIAGVRAFWEEARERFVLGYTLYGDEWVGYDLDAMRRQEDLDSAIYGFMPTLQAEQARREDAAADSPQR